MVRNPYEEGNEGKVVLVLDYGSLQLIEHWGCDERIIESARMSTGKGFLGWGPQWECQGCGAVKNTWDASPTCNNDSFLCPSSTMKKLHNGDERLLRYLREHKHTTPFEMAGMVIEVQAPIMVFREWHRHRTQSYNEMSARYVPLPDVNYLPTPERCLVVAGKNKQANAVAGAEELTHEKVLSWLTDLSDTYEHCEATYQSGLRIGIPKEIARLPVPVGRYSRMRASANLKNWLDFLTLRMDEHAQWEIRQFANECGKLIKLCFPKTWDLFVENKPMFAEVTK